MSITVLRIFGLGLSALTLALTLGSCGKVADGNLALLDSNTNWLMHCTDDIQCNGSLRCYCGICTKPCGQDSECGLLSGAECAESGESLCGAQASAGGLCVRACKQSSECGDGFNCTAGECVPKPCVTLQARDWDEVFKSIRTDLASSAPEDTAHFRYFAIGNSSADSDSARGCGVEPEVQRKALTKLVNSLSSSPRITEPTAISPDGRLLRIDLRDYGWDRQAQVGGAHPDVWEALVANDLYSVSFSGSDADEVTAETGTLEPLLLVDSFVATATRPDVYYGVLGTPEYPLPSLSDELGISLFGQASVEAIFLDPSLMLAQYWPIATRAGYLWSIADFGRETGALFFDSQLLPAGEREIVYSLPNGLYAFAFVGTGRQRIDGWQVTADREERDGLARVPRSNWRRHPHAVNVRDDSQAYLAANSNQLDATKLSTFRGRFSGNETLQLVIQRDYQTILEPSLISLGIDSDEPDPILASFAEFDRDVTLEVAAEELLVTPQTLRRNLGLLDPRLAALDGGSVSRSLFTVLYRQSVCLLSTALENQPDPGSCP